MHSLAKTRVAIADDLLASGGTEEAHKAVEEAIMTLDRAAERGVIHRNNAARRKSRLMMKLNKATKAAPSEKPKATKAAKTTHSARATKKATTKTETK